MNKSHLGLLITLVLITGFGLRWHVTRTYATCTPPSTSGDTIVCNGSNGTLNANNGDDHITNNAGATTGNINGQNGNDTITNNGTVTGAMTGGSGNDTITNNTTGNTIDGGLGNDTITNNGTVSSITGGSNAPVITIIPPSISFDGDDNITNNGTVTGDISGGMGNDTITNYNSVDDIDGGLGDDTITNNGTADDIDSGLGNDTITNDGTADDIDSGLGDDTITNNGTADDIYSGAGDDVINNDGTVDLIDTDSGDDEVNIGVDGIVNSNISTGTLLFLLSDDDTVVVDGVVNGYILTDVLSNGEDTVIINGEVNGNLLSYAIMTGDGDDTIELNGNVNASVHTGDDDDTVQLLVGVTINGIIEGGDESDTLTFEYTFEGTAAEFAALQEMLNNLPLTCPVTGCPVSFVLGGLNFTYYYGGFEYINSLLTFIEKAVVIAENPPTNVTPGTVIVGGDIDYAEYEEIPCKNGVRCFALKQGGFRTGVVQVYAAQAGRAIGVFTVDFNQLDGDFSYTNPNNGWTLFVKFTGRAGDAENYNILISHENDVRDAAVTIEAFNFNDTNAFTNALGWQ